MLAGGARHDRGRSVPVIARRDHDHIDAFVLKETAHIDNGARRCPARCLGDSTGGGFNATLIDIADDRDFDIRLTCERARQSGAAAAGADDADDNALVGVLHGGGEARVGIRERDAGAGRGGGAHKGAAI
jgi:hypothetical protein